MFSPLLATSERVGQKYPGEQTEFGVFKAMPAQTEPAGHGVQSVTAESPVALLKVPERQGCGEMVACGQ